MLIQWRQQAVELRRGQVWTRALLCGDGQWSHLSLPPTSQAPSPRCAMRITGTTTGAVPLGESFSRHPGSRLVAAHYFTLTCWSHRGSQPVTPNCQRPSVALLERRHVHVRHPRFHTRVVTFLCTDRVPGTRLDVCLYSLL